MIPHYATPRSLRVFNEHQHRDTGHPLPDFCLQTTCKFTIPSTALITGVPQQDARVLTSLCPTGSWSAVWHICIAEHGLQSLERNATIGNGHAADVIFVQRAIRGHDAALHTAIGSRRHGDGPHDEGERRKSKRQYADVFPSGPVHDGFLPEVGRDVRRAVPGQPSLVFALREASYEANC